MVFISTSLDLQEGSIFRSGGGPFLQHFHPAESSEKPKRGVREDLGSCWQVHLPVGAWVSDLFPAARPRASTADSCRLDDSRPACGMSQAQVQSLILASLSRPRERAVGVGVSEGSLVTSKTARLANEPRINLLEGGAWLTAEKRGQLLLGRTRTQVASAISCRDPVSVAFVLFLIPLRSLFPGEGVWSAGPGSPITSPVPGEKMS